MEPKPFTVKFFMDGNQWCATFEDFINLQESPAGFGRTCMEALGNLKDSEATGAYGHDWETL